MLQSARNWMRTHPALGCLLISSIALFLLIGSGIAFCVGNPQYYHAKYQRPPNRSVPSQGPFEYETETQTEPHTCGFHACSTIYRAYLLDPEEKKLRFRLGTDKQGTNFDPESLGTLHPDIVRVLAQDGFETNVLLQPAADDAKEIKAHLDSRHPVLAMIRVKGLHWVAIEGGYGEIGFVHDSLKQRNERIEIIPYVKEHVLSAILVKPQPQ